MWLGWSELFGAELLSTGGKMKDSILTVKLIIMSAAFTLSAPLTALAQGGCFADFDQKFAQWTNNNPQKSNWGMRDTYQYAYFMGTEGLKILQEYRSCMSDADFAANYEALKGARDQGRKGCLQTSSTGDCQPRYPG